MLIEDSGPRLEPSRKRSLLGQNRESMGQAGKPPAGPGLKDVGLGSSTGSGGCGVAQGRRRRQRAAQTGSPEGLHPWPSHRRPWEQRTRASWDLPQMKDGRRSSEALSGQRG